MNGLNFHSLTAVMAAETSSCGPVFPQNVHEANATPVEGGEVQRQTLARQQW